MLKKISGYATRFLFYVRNNFLSFIFKLSVFLTLLTLIYLVCVLKQSNSTQKRIEVQQVASSQKLILDIPNTTELPHPTTADDPTTMNNLISKVEIHLEPEESFPIQDQTTPLMMPIESTTPLRIEEQTVLSMMSIDTTMPLLTEEQTTHKMEYTEASPLCEDSTNPESIPDDAPPSLENATTSASVEEETVPAFNEDAPSFTPTPSTEAYIRLRPLEDSTFPHASIDEHPLFPNHNQPSVTQGAYELLPSMPALEETTPVIDSIQTHPLFPILEQASLPPEDEAGYPPASLSEQEPSIVAADLPLSLPMQEPLITDTAVHLSLPTYEPSITDATESIWTTPASHTEEESTLPTMSEELTEIYPEPKKTTQLMDILAADPAAPFKRSLTLNELKLFDTTMDTTPETATFLTYEDAQPDPEEDHTGHEEDQTDPDDALADPEDDQTAPEDAQADPEDAQANPEAAQTDAEVATFSDDEQAQPELKDPVTDSTPSPNEISVEETTPETVAPSPTETPAHSDLFGDIPDDEETDFPPLTAPESYDDTVNLFQDDDDDLDAMPAPNTDPETDEEEPHESTNVGHIHTPTVVAHEDGPPAFNANPFDFQHNLFNLFNFDHLPAMSNIKPIHWPNVAPAHPRQQLNTIYPIAEEADDQASLQRRLHRYQQLDSLLNMRIKDSVTLLERLFGNFLT